MFIETPMHNTNKNTGGLLKKLFNAWLSWKKIKSLYKVVSPQLICLSFKAQSLSYRWEMDTRQSLVSKQD